MLSSRYVADGNPTIHLNAGQIAARKSFLEKLKTGHYRLAKLPCLVCSGSKFERLAEKDRYGLPVTVVLCRDCGLIQSNPYLDEASCKEFYDVEYRPLYVGTEHPNREFFARQVQQGQKILTRIERAARKITPGMTVVEIGCGAGGILMPFRARGCRVLGFDWGRDYLEFGRTQHGLDLRVGGLEALPNSIRPDVVIYSHVLEHIPDPRAELRRLRSLAHSETRIYLEVPGVKNIHRAYDGDFLAYLQNAHVAHFSQRTLETLLHLEGFKVTFANECVECICQAATEESRLPANDCIEVLAYLRKLETDRSRIRLNPLNRLRKHSVAVLNRTGLKESIRRLFRL